MFDERVDLLRGQQVAERRHDARKPAPFAAVVNDRPPVGSGFGSRLVA